MGLPERFIRNYRERAHLLAERGVLGFLRSSSGYVLIIVLILTTLLVSIAGEFIAVAHVNIGYGQKLKNQLKASYLAKSGVQMAQFILYADLKGVTTEMLTGKPTDKEIDSYNDLWAISFPTLPIEDGSLRIQISDENAKINLSVLANEFTAESSTKFYYFTQNFLMNMGLPIDFADIIRDWVDVDDSRLPYGAEGGDFYQSQTPPYTAKNNAMDSIDELMLIKDMTPLIFYGKGGGNTEAEKNEQNLVEHNKGSIDLDLDKIRELVGGSGPNTEDAGKNRELTAIGKERSRMLSDYFTAYGDRNDYLSDFNKININTASYRVLSALTDKMTPDIVTEIINMRLIQPFKSVDEIKDLISDTTILERLSVKSHIFKIVATADSANTQVRITAYYNRDMRNLYYWCEE
ncbi:MAG TPA: general secretion pathway protein GspK [Spirochaetota bacterium]|nr:general secretion pathway protein GspK [Spirochaetota bacterium]